MVPDFATLCVPTAVQTAAYIRWLPVSAAHGWRCTVGYAGLLAPINLLVGCMRPSLRLSLPAVLWFSTVCDIANTTVHIKRFIKQMRMCSAPWLPCCCIWSPCSISQRDVCHRELAQSAYVITLQECASTRDSCSNSQRRACLDWYSRHSNGLHGQGEVSW